MGNRANFGVRMDGHILFIYQHWAPENLMDQYAEALTAALPRVGDPWYSSRIIASQIIGDRWDGELGYGFSIDAMLDNEHSVVIYDPMNGFVEFYKNTWHEDMEPTYVMRVDKFIQKYSKHPALA